jgi:PadR family transcriptional regulator PadR
MIKGHLELALLRILKDRELHGYAIVQMLNLSGDNVPSEGSVYPLLLKLEKNGYVFSHWQDGRKLYKMSKKGFGLFDQKLLEWRSFSSQFESFLVKGAT